MDVDVTGAPVLSLRQFSKSFGGTQALHGVDLDVLPGEVHALVGQNGSGKSTLIKVLSGYHAPDEGTVEIRGRQVRLPFHSWEARQHGLSFLHQDLGLAENMTVLENLRLGRYSTTWYGRLRWRRERKTVRALLAGMNLSVHTDTPVRRVPQAERALVAFLRAAQDVGATQGILVLDEPTAHLPLPAVRRLFAAVREIVRQGAAVLFVSHRLEEVLELSDRVSVLRDGRLVGTVKTAETNQEQLVSMMLGREIGRLYPDRLEAHGEAVLQTRHLSGGLVSDLNLSVHAGEIVGLTGLVGMGHDDVPYLLAGSRPLSAGEIAVGTRSFTHPSPATMRRAGVALLPADRQHTSGVLSATVLENVTLPTLGRYFRAGHLRHRAARTDVQSLLHKFEVRPPDPLRTLATLSGGNQQKVLLAKWLQTNPRLLILHEPTQGVDIGSRKQIFSIIQEVAASGVAVLIASAEYEDLANLCNRVVIMRRGRVVSELTGSHLTEDYIVQQCYLAA